MTTKKVKIINVVSEPEVEQTLTEEDFKSVCKEYRSLKEQMSVLEKTIKQYKEIIDEYMDAHCQLDTRGHRWFSVGDYYLERQRRQATPKLKEEEAGEILKKLGVYDQVVKEVTDYEYNGDVLAQLVSEGKIPEEDFNKMFEPGKISYATLVISKEAKEKYEDELASDIDGD